MRKLTPAQIKKSRERLDMTQAEFCKAFHLELRTYQKWEIGEKPPSASAAVLLWLIDRIPAAIMKAFKDG
jgi:DNA-binding transcriptional regulator YiaG